MLAAQDPQLENYWDRVILLSLPSFNNSQWEEDQEGQRKALTSSFQDLTVCRKVLFPSPLWPNRKLGRVSRADCLWMDKKIPLYEAKEAAHYYLTFKALSNFEGGKKGICYIGILENQQSCIEISDMKKKIHLILCVKS